MKCVHCQGELKRGTAPLHIDRGGCHITIDNVPAWVCDQCGESLFEEREVQTIQDLVLSVEEKARTLAKTG